MNDATDQLNEIRMMISPFCEEVTTIKGNSRSRLIILRCSGKKAKKNQRIILDQAKAYAAGAWSVRKIRKPREKKKIAA